ncbi:von Willebrand factor type A domain protein [Aquisphaera giovannonii]|uniref:von Willebrand factor type A domain protein n=1 Tax=Aquisphaera giovannonii TaxID=406548 RepID=A0A5B9W3C4_9BACT|nr:VWA domain-containing protein [Aquisphaera giovannonii]QEH34591.1 von Willebrand factor type A domain protein [Aquisphaera giovannonii]
MSFAYPWVLGLLAVPVLLLGWTWRRTGGRIALPFDHGGQPSGRAWSIVLKLAESLPALLLGVAIVILAGPQHLSAPKSRRVLTNIEFCVDVSGSMTSPLGEGTRYDASMKAIDEFLKIRQGDAFGLTFFGNNVLHWVPLTSDPSAIRCAPPFMKPENAPVWMGGTMIGKALLACREVLTSREEGDRMIILVSDGDSFDLSGGNDESVAQTLKKDGIVVYSIHISSGDPPGEIVNITGLTGGEVFPVDDPQALRAVFRRIDTMKATRMEKTAPELLDDFAPFCMAGLTLLGATGLTLLGLRYTPW